MAALFPLAAGMLLFGWRALFSVAILLLSTFGAAVIWRQIGWRGRMIRYSHCLWMGLLLCLMLPPHLLSSAPRNAPAYGPLWPILPAAGILLVILIWLLGGVGSGRFHPAVVAYLLLFVLFHEQLVPHYVLRRDHIFTGDLLSKTSAEPTGAMQPPWIDRVDSLAGEAWQADPASQVLIEYTTPRQSASNSDSSLKSLIRDELPPLEDLVIAGHPGPIGSASACAVILGGLFLLYRGLIDFRIPLLATLTALVAILVLPIPVLHLGGDAQWRWLALRGHSPGWQTALTFANYELLASPLLLTVFFLATAPVARPMTKRGRAVYAIIVGFLAAAAQLYLSVAAGPYFALIPAAMLTPLLDRMFRPRHLV